MESVAKKNCHELHKLHERNLTRTSNCTGAWVVKLITSGEGTMKVEVFDDADSVARAAAATIAAAATKTDAAKL